MQAQVVRTPEQLEECLNVRMKVFVEEQKVPRHLEVDELDGVNQAIHVILRDEMSLRAVGTARIKRVDPETAKIQRVAILKEERLAGRGRTLMNFVESTAYEQGCKRAILDAQLTAEPFYQRLGYTRVSDETFLDAGILHVRMEKRLASSH